MNLDSTGLTLGKEDGAKGAYIRKAVANVGEFSLVEKIESNERIEAVTVYLPDNGRSDGPKAGKP